ncbi:MAG: LPS export ABC transporter periplasmic protein LptC [Burkholderiales bacterium]|nr:LPS export ABC transporter periplasmic protein LptC [Burkholderiales bacterium]
MKNTLTADRFRIWLGVALLALATLAGLWMLEAIRRNGDDGHDRAAARLDPDYYVEQFNFIKLSNTGKANYHITGERLTHLPRADNFEISQPRISSFDEQNTPLHIRAERAIVEQKSSEVFPKREQDQVHLYDQVSVERPAGANARYMRLQTDYLLLLPDADLIKTDRAVLLSTDNSETHATGMLADNNSQQLQLLSKVRVRLKRSGSAAPTR